MKRVLGLLAATTLLTSGAVALGAGSVGAAATTTPVVPIVQTIDLPVEVHGGVSQVYVVHGLNLAGQTTQTARGTAVSVCAGPDLILPNLEFGDIAGPLPLPIGEDIPITVTVGANVPCGTGTPAISQIVKVPNTPAVALVATAPLDGPPELKPVELDVATDFCKTTPPTTSAPVAVVTPENANLQAVHAAAAGPVNVKVNTLLLEGIVFGENPSLPVVPGDYTVTVLLGTTPIVGPAVLPLKGCTLTVVYVVGNQPLPEAPTTTEAPAAAAVAAKPAFTG